MTEANRGRGRGGRERGRGRMVDPENDLNQRHRDPKDIEIEEQRQRIEELERRLALAKNGDPIEEEEESDSVTKEEERGDNPFWNRGRNQGFRPRGQSTPTFGMKIEIPEFEGNSHPDEFVDWLQTVERVFDLKDIEDGQRVKLVTIRLREQASVWWEHVRRKRAREGKSKVKTWEKMKKLLKRKYLPSHYRREALNEYHLFRQRELERQLAEARRGSTRGGKRGQKVTEHDADREARRNQQLRREVIQGRRIRVEKEIKVFGSGEYNQKQRSRRSQYHDDVNLLFSDWLSSQRKENSDGFPKHERSSYGRKAQRESCWEDENNDQVNPNLFDSFETCVVDSMLVEVNALPNFDQEFESQESRDSKADEVQNDLDRLEDYEGVVVWDEDSDPEEELPDVVAENDHSTVESDVRGLNEEIIIVADNDVVADQITSQTEISTFHANCEKVTENSTNCETEIFPENSLLARAVTFDDQTDLKIDLDSIEAEAEESIGPKVDLLDPVSEHQCVCVQENQGPVEPIFIKDVSSPLDCAHGSDMELPVAPSPCYSVVTKNTSIVSWDTYVDEDSVRLLATESYAIIGASNLFEFCGVEKTESTRMYFVHEYDQLFGGNEAGHIIATFGKFTESCQICDPGTAFPYILPNMKELSLDPSQLVRLSLASVIMRTPNYNYDLTELSFMIWRNAKFKYGSNRGNGRREVVEWVSSWYSVDPLFIWDKYPEEDKVWKPGIDVDDEDIQDSRTNLFLAGEYNASGIG